jgi:hypothetical protein
LEEEEEEEEGEGKVITQITHGSIFNCYRTRLRNGGTPSVFL